MVLLVRLLAWIDAWTSHVGVGDGHVGLALVWVLLVVHYLVNLYHWCELALSVRDSWYGLLSSIRTTDSHRVPRLNLMDTLSNLECPWTLLLRFILTWLLEGALTYGWHE